MKIGASFPTTQIGNDPIAIRDYAQALEGAGFDYTYCPTHDLGADKSRFDPPPFNFRPENSGITYTYETPWHEPLTLFTYLAAVTTTLEFVPSVVYLAQRQAPLVAKQVAEIDLLSGGRFHLNVGTGWNFTEYEALGMDWETRGERIEEQIQVVKQLWTQDVVTFQGKYHTLDRVGINPLPPHSTDIWYAGSARNVVLSRAARLCDGFMALLIWPEEPEMCVERLQNHLDKAGKKLGEDFKLIASAPNRGTAPGQPAQMGGFGPGDPTYNWQDRARLWKKLGATHLGLMGGAAATAAEALERTLEIKRQFDQEVGAD